VHSEGVLDVSVLDLWELSRPREMQSKEWIDRQAREMDSGFRASNELEKHRKGEFIIGNVKIMTVADITVVHAVGHIDSPGGDRSGRIDVLI
jgi:hypothetical protein